MPINPSTGADQTCALTAPAEGQTVLKWGAQAQITDSPSLSACIPPEHPRAGRDQGQDGDIPEHHCFAAG